MCISVIQMISKTTVASAFMNISDFPLGLVEQMSLQVPSRNKSAGTSLQEVPGIGPSRHL